MAMEEKVNVKCDNIRVQLPGSDRRKRGGKADGQDSKYSILTYKGLRHWLLLME